MGCLGQQYPDGRHGRSTRTEMVGPLDVAPRTDLIEDRHSMLVNFAEVYRRRKLDRTDLYAGVGLAAQPLPENLAILRSKIAQELDALILTCHDGLRNRPKAAVGVSAGSLKVGPANPGDEGTLNHKEAFAYSNDCMPWDSTSKGATMKNWLFARRRLTN
ncbi:hypothetical protein ACCAA_620004 [Candidatus Accumulibacter aalborgensis]|uniref:Uncharacterized protein n=1 Tax=Candidatus Accumulibacter aalborgensis TaxID=1860102 RepID=A0A1A8XUJ1_9PROT|nr:hypothetical protein ACCAA_620004 [Candidatus Accumulibacter aalborgensis]